MRILIIEDEQEIREEISDILRFEGQEVASCSNGEEGVKAAYGSPPDIILCDIYMSGTSGFDVLQKIRENPSTSLTPFIFITAMDERNKLRKGMDLGADDYLVKPFSREELLNAVGSRLQRSNAIKKQLDQLKNNIIYAIPHELRTPLNGIMGFSKILKDDADAFSIKEIRGMGESVYKSAARLYDLIEKYLMFIDVQLNSNNVLLNNVAINRKYMEKRVHKIAEKFGRTEDYTLEVPDFNVNISENWFSFALNELIDNAFKFSDAGTNITLKACKKENRIDISIEDHGYGFPPGSIDNINAFVQFDRKTKEQQGTGLGLFLAQRIAQLHQGEMKIENRQDKKTVVTFTLPLAEQIS